mmetsp:Transcript_8809/g.15880  ORF Transcript_8809/g.15880 Transcript_8809/m.15880 type:complete len:295 (-) Transcript_8809:580-1464(-)|eukprot:CAMPEP_0182443514 /NCGR_PEP_ID=MMETSP1172-20130603/2233_1 /TAXON_ID=708627 /ORGANISM="Timspurckia oligopyrenoides, Strain CCMP3278" /LENGTH=294 /DNA_ID=CAMNT_0024638825 /DNA_START=322 /DNA_END=1206 /DNA_ORIENTATION=+
MDSTRDSRPRAHYRTAFAILGYSRFWSSSSRNSSVRAAKQKHSQVLALAQRVTCAAAHNTHDQPVISMENVFFSWRDGKTGKISTPVLRDVSLQVFAGELVMMVGGNGSGKSTLLKLLKHLYFPDSGRITVPKRTTIVLQNAGSSLLMPSVGTEILASLPPTTEEKDLSSQMNYFLRSVRIPGYANRHCADLSGGERQRVAVASALAAQSPAMLCDEVTASMDSASRRHIVKLFRNEVVDEKKTAVLWVTHLLEELEYADRVIVLDKGAVTHDTTPEQLSSVLADLKRERVFWN